METTIKIEQALNLKQEVDQFAELMLQLIDTDLDDADQKDRVRLKAVPLPEKNGAVLSGAVRFKKCGAVRALGIRQSEPGAAGSVEITFRTLRTKTAIVKKIVDPNLRNQAKVVTAWFRPDGGVIRYQEETRRTKSSA
jgi:hypothetical protein